MKILLQITLFLFCFCVYGQKPEQSLACTTYAVCEFTCGHGLFYLIALLDDF